MNRKYDVIVVGAGPAGSTTARFCAQAELKTLIIEKEELPRYKPCGGCLSIKTVNLLGLDLSSVIENTIYEVHFSYYLKDSFSIRSTQPIAFLVMRDRFDHLLTHQALEKGAEILEGKKVVKAKEISGGVEVELESGENLCCEILVGADGAKSVVARTLSLRPPKKTQVGMGLESEIPFHSLVNFHEEHRHCIHLDFGRIPSGYGWVFPKSEGLSIGIGGMFMEAGKKNLHQCFIDFLNGLSYLSQGVERKMMGHPLPSFYDEKQKVSKGRTLLVGDAAFLIDPLTGEGIYYAIRSGMLAAEAIFKMKGKGILPSEQYQEAIRKNLFENLKWALLFARFVYQFNKLSYQTLRNYPELGTLYLQVLEGKESYQGFVMRVKQRVKDLLRGHLSKKMKQAIEKF